MNTFLERMAHFSVNKKQYTNIENNFVCLLSDGTWQSNKLIVFHSNFPFLARWCSSRSWAQQTILPPLSFVAPVDLHTNSYISWIPDFEAISSFALGQEADESKLFLTEPPSSQERGKIVWNLIDIRFQRKISR